MDKEINDIVKLIQTYRTHDYWTVFGDFVDMLAEDIHCSVQVLMHRGNNEREKKYSGYTKTEKENFIKIGTLLVKAMDKAQKRRRLYDIIGRVFHELSANSKKAGQFFTPEAISNLAAKTVDSRVIEAAIKQKGYFVISDDCCGGGSLLLGVANTMFDMNYDPRKYLYVVAGDADRRCVNMCYIHLSLYGIAGMVKHQNCLEDKIYKGFITPPAIINYWCYKLLKQGE